MAIDKDTLFKSVVPEEDVELDGKGSVRVRALTRDELHQVNAYSSRGSNSDEKRTATASRDAELMAVHYGLVDPPLDINEVKEYAKAAAVGEFQRITKTIMRLSGVGANEKEVRQSTNDAYADFRE